MPHVMFSAFHRRYLTLFGRIWRGGLAWLACSIAFSAHALETQVVATGFNQPLFATAPDGDSRLFVVEKGGLIRILQNGSILPTPFLDLSAAVDTAGERGLLGMAFDPDFATNRRLYVNYIDKTTLNTVVATYQVATPLSNQVDATTRQTVISIAQPAGQSNHKGGWIGFRPGEANNLYIGTGDGGSSNDPQNRAQNLNDNLGKMLRVDVSADTNLADTTHYGYAIPAGNLVGGNPEIYAYGLRNPFRNSFDRQTGTLYIADVGQNNREEINIGAAGANYGWRKFEGTRLNFPGDAAIASPVAPIYEYDHNGSGASITGGYVYRGSVIGGLQGTYFFADFVDDKVFSFRLVGNSVTEFTDRTAELLSPTGISGGIASFAEDGFGNLYLVSINGGIGLISAVPEPAMLAMLLAGLLVVAARARRFAQ
jgi:glucose/arabinose dehydrogenase